MEPPIEPMLAKVATGLPAEGDWLYEPKWDGFRALVFRNGRDAFIQSRDLNPLDRYFPELHALFVAALPAGCVLDGEIVIAGPRGLDFDALQMRLHPAASRIGKLAAQTPASFVAFDVLAVRGRDVMARAQSARREALEALLAKATVPIHLTPMTRDRALALDWLARFEGAGLDGVIAKHAALPYRPGERAMFKVKHARTADCVVTGLRRHKSGADAVGSLQLSLYDAAGKALHPVGGVSAFTMDERRRLARELAPLLTKERVEGKASRWNAGRDATWEALRPAKVCEVKYDHLQGDRFRHPAQFLRWRPDKAARDCRFDQLEVTTPYELAKVFGA